MAIPPRYRLRALGLLLLPTYAAHLAEEYWGGPGFAAWVERAAGIHLTVGTWFSLNALFAGVMAAGIAAGWIREEAEWLLVPFGTAVGVNGLLHAGLSIATRSYSPGTVTGILLWIPLALAILQAARGRFAPRAIRAGIGVGVLLHIGVTLSAYSSSLPD